MRPSNSSRRPKTQRNVSTRRSSSRTSSSTRRGESDRRSRTSSSRRGGEEDRKSGGRKPKKPDNTKMIIGMSVGGFFLLILIIAAAASGGGSNSRPATSNGGSTSSKKSTFTLPVDARKKIFREYITQQNKIEDEAMAKMSSIPATGDRRKEGTRITSEKNSKLSALRAELSEKYRKKYPEASGTFIRKIINEGIDKNWR